MSSVPCSNSIRFLYWLLSFIDVDTLLASGVECLLPRHGGASIQSLAYSNFSDEIGIRPDIPVETVQSYSETFVILALFDLLDLTVVRSKRTPSSSTSRPQISSNIC